MVIQYIVMGSMRMKAWLISDTYFDHKNIIKYTGRPFRLVDEMNETMRSNWNNAVRKNNIVCFLGDMSFGRGPGSAT